MKLIRNRIPTLALTRGEVMKVREVQSETELRELLLAKLGEEYTELRAAVEAENVEQVQRELADVREVVESLTDLCGRSRILAVQESARGRRGGFTPGIVWEES